MNLDTSRNCLFPRKDGELCDLVFWPDGAFNLDMFMAFVHCEVLEPTCQNDARAPTSVCGALAETCLRGAMIEQTSS